MSVRLYCHCSYVNIYVYWSAFLSLSVCLSLRYIVGNHTCIRTSLDSYFFLSLCLWICVAVSGYFITHWCGDLNNRTAKEVPTSQSDNDVFARAAEKNTNVIFRGHCIEFIWESYWICVPLLDWIFWMEFVMATYRVVIHSCIILEIGWVIILLFSDYLFFSYSAWLSPSCYGKNRVRPFATGIVYKWWRNNRTYSRSRYKWMYWKVYMESWLCLGIYWIYSFWSNQRITESRFQSNWCGY